MLLLLPAAHHPMCSCLRLCLQGQLLPRLEDESPVSLIKVLLFFAKLGPGHVEMFEKVTPQSDRQQA